MKFKPIYAIFILLICIGFIIVMVTEKNRGEAERRLASEQIVTGTMNKQIIAGQEALADYEKWKEDAAKERQFNRSLYGRDTPPPEVVQQQIEEHLRKLAQSASKTP